MGGKMKNEVALIENSNYAIARYWGYRYAIRLPEIFDTVVHQIELEMESAKNRSTYIYVLLWNMLRYFETVTAYGYELSYDAFTAGFIANEINESNNFNIRYGINNQDSVKMLLKNSRPIKEFFYALYEELRYRGILESYRSSTWNFSFKNDWTIVLKAEDKPSVKKPDGITKSFYRKDGLRNG